MFKIATLNKISSAGLALLDEKYTITSETAAADGILVRSQDMHSMELSRELKAVARAGAGVNNIPLDKCADQGIVVFNTPGANANAVKELVLAGMLLAARNIPGALDWAASLKENVGPAVEKGKAQFAGSEILGKTLGVVGLGAIGRKVAASAHALGMNIIGYDPYYAGGVDEAVICSSVEELLPQCDYVTIHVPATDSTKGMFNSSLFALMKPSAVLLNFSRDKLVNDSDLLQALRAGQLAAYVTDFPNDALAAARSRAAGDEAACGEAACDEAACGRRIILLPHLGASTEEAEENCAAMAVKQTRDYLENGNIINSVNFPRVDMGPRGDKIRLGLLLKNVSDPAAFAGELLSAASVETAAVQGAVRGDYAYALAELAASSAAALSPESAAGLAQGDERVIRVMLFK